MIDRIQAELKQAMKSGDKTTVSVSGGYAVYPTDAEDAGSMVGIARERMLAKVTRPPAAGSSAAPPKGRASDSQRSRSGR